MSSSDSEARSRIVLRYALALLAASASGLLFARYLRAEVPHPPVAGDQLKAQDLEDNFAYLESLAAGTADCPSGYSHDGTVTAFTLCTKGADEIVKVGDGSASFWIDRYEASAWSTAAGSGTQYGASAADFPVTFPGNGQWTAAVFAVSKKNVSPSANITWFQASEACGASGKRLPNGPEWLRAARGTVDSGSSNGTGGACVTQGTSARLTGLGTTCVSAWGAEDMIGNVEEWTADGVMAVQAAVNSCASDCLVRPWPSPQYGSDATYGIASEAYAASSGPKVAGLPAALVRGGAAYNGLDAGLFYANANLAPSGWTGTVGFRCVTTR